ncbi:heavy metal translocating P-type ATPase metal-binding domain-containing protein [bacterium]|nr:heavy metal translocating P-type ATPase metal-binding domain-containing protein [bacterium]
MSDRKQSEVISITQTDVTEVGVKDSTVACFHCGERCEDSTIAVADKIFCCNGCRWVYQLLADNDMTDYYAFTEEGRITPIASKDVRFEYLDNPTILEKIIQFRQDNFARVTLFLPQIHCSACIWLLENLTKLDLGILNSQVNFLRKEVSLTFDETKTSLRAVAELLAAIGYTPDFSQTENDRPNRAVVERSLYIKLGIAAFCFGNIMLIALPEYLSGGTLDADFRAFFGYLSIALSVPVLYSISDYFKSAITSIRQKVITMDVPIAIGISTLILRSIYEIITATGSGYLDSLAGLAFFLLLGKIFQKKTFHSLSFERNYRSYFPIAVIRKEPSSEKSVPIDDIRIGDKLLIRHHELIPADSILLSDEALIDYSFVTGESAPVRVTKNERLFAGGKQTGGLIEIEVIKDVSQSYLTQLWNQDIFIRHTSRITTISEKVAHYFTFSILAIALLTAIFWIIYEPSLAANVFTSVLIVSCGCGLPLSVPFTFGTTLRVFASNKLFLKNEKVVERLATVDTMVFDKTGTLTLTQTGTLKYEGVALTHEEQSLVKSLARQSTHPMSRRIFESLSEVELQPIENFEEIQGCGVQAKIQNKLIQIGSYRWISGSNEMKSHATDAGTRVFVAINYIVKGWFSIGSEYRQGAKELAVSLPASIRVVILSGDNDRESESLKELFGHRAEMKFNQLPIDKLNYVRQLQAEGHHVMMIGDGLNDAGALKQSDVGIAITENTASFTPSSDAIMETSQLKTLLRFITLAKRSKKIVYAAFALTLTYNFIALSFAVQGLLAPVIAAVIMPISAISVVSFTVLAVTWSAKKNKLNSMDAVESSVVNHTN